MTVGRVGRTVLVVMIVCYVTTGGVASYRAYFPIRAVRIHVSEDVLRPGTGVRVDTVTSGRGPVSIRVELLQGGQPELVVSDAMPAKRWAYWDPRPVFHSTDATLAAWVAERFQPGVITVRATVTGAPAWLRQPPPVVEEVRMPFRVGRDADRLE